MTEAHLGFRQQVQQDAEVVGDASAEDEQVPDHMAVGEFLPEIEDDAKGIGKSASADVDDGFMRHLQPEFSAGDDDEPSHGQIENQSHSAESADEDAGEKNADDGQRPDGDHQTQPPTSPKANQ